MKARHHPGLPRRRGLTRLDVIVSLFIIVVLIVVFLPATYQQRHHRGRPFACMNNIRNVGFAIQNFASGSQGKLPSLSTEIRTETGKGEKGFIPVGWPILLLPSLDATALLRRIKTTAEFESATNTQVKLKIADTEKIWMPSFTCAADPTAYRMPGRLSFVVNAGFMSRSLYQGDPAELHRLELLSWDGDNISNEEADVRIGAATGVFWRQCPSFQTSLDNVIEGDGTSSTLMLVENLQAGNWFDTDTTRISFGLPVETNGAQVPFGAGSFFESVEKPLNTVFGGGTLGTATPQDWRINADIKATIGTRPRPSSNHKGGVNILFCDGAAKYLSDTIDAHLYVKLLTPNGMKFGEGEQPRSDHY